MDNTIYTTRRENDGYFTALILEAGSRQVKEESCFTLEELKSIIADTYGDIQRISPRLFQEEINNRTVHSDEMLSLLRNNVEGDLSQRYVYGSPMRPMSSVWARLPGAAIYIPCDRQKTGYHTYVAVLAKLDKEIVDKYDLVFVSHGGTINATI
jgi:hypothetical protein